VTILFCDLGDGGCDTHFAAEVQLHVTIEVHTVGWRCPPHPPDALVEVERWRRGRRVPSNHTLGSLRTPRTPERDDDALEPCDYPAGLCDVVRPAIHARAQNRCEAVRVSRPVAC